MKYIYTATFVPNEDGTKYYCRIPDLPGCITTGDSIDDAIEMITDAASGWHSVPTRSVTFVEKIILGNIQSVCL